MSQQPVPFVTIPFKDGLMRIWTSTKGTPYKLEVRSKEYMGYHNVEEFPKLVKILARFIK